MADEQKITSMVLKNVDFRTFHWTAFEGQESDYHPQSFVISGDKIKELADSTMKKIHQYDGKDTISITAAKKVNVYTPDNQKPIGELTLNDDSPCLTGEGLSLNVVRFTTKFGNDGLRVNAILVNSKDDLKEVVQRNPFADEANEG